MFQKYSIFKKPDRNTAFIAAIIVSALLFLYPLFQPLFYISHDGDAHLARFAAYYQAFQDGQIPPRWAGNLNFSYGTPVFNFYYPLPGYLASLIHFIGISFETTFKILIITVFIAAPVFFYMWEKLLFKKEIAFIGALMYGFAPYHFLNLYVRGDVAELMALMFIPLVFYCIEKIIQQPKQPTKKNISVKHAKIGKIASIFNRVKSEKSKYIFLGSIFYALLILSHNGISLMFSPVFLLYSLLRINNMTTLFKIFFLLFFGLLLAAFFWLPALYESKYTNIHLFVGDMFKYHFPTLQELFYSQWGFGPDVRKEGGLSPQIGVLYIVMTLASIFLAIKHKKHRKMVLGWLVVFFAAVFITLPISSFVWGQLPILRLYEFPWRFTALSSFAAVMLACYVLAEFKNNKLLFGIFILLLITSIPFVRVKEYVTYSDKYYMSHTGTTYYHGEASPIWTAGDPTKFPKAPIEFIENKGKISNVVRKSHVHTFTVESTSATKIVDNTTYFPGWKVTVDGNKVPIEFQDQNYRGLITFQVPKGKHNVKVEFGESPIRFAANSISLIAVALFIVYFLYEKLRKK